MLIDTHTHLNFIVFNKDWRKVVKRAIEAGVGKMIVVGTDIKSSRRAVEMSEKHPALYASVGVHPHHARGFCKTTNYYPKARSSKSQMTNIKKQLTELADNKKVVAIGEVGLDYYQYKQSKYSSTSLKIDNKLKLVQKELLGMQVKLALKFRKPLIIHSRQANEEVLELLLRKESDVRGVFHCFEGNRKYLGKVLAAGFYISFTGKITYSPDRELVAATVPLNRLLLETDSPFMAPQSLRGKRNEPANVKIIAQYQAVTRGVQLNKVINQTSRNAEKLFEYD